MGRLHGVVVQNSVCTHMHGDVRCSLRNIKICWRLCTPARDHLARTRPFSCSFPLSRILIFFSVSLTMFLFLALFLWLSLSLSLSLYLTPFLSLFLSLSCSERARLSLLLSRALSLSLCHSPSLLHSYTQLLTRNFSNDNTEDDEISAVDEEPWSSESEDDEQPSVCVCMYKYIFVRNDMYIYIHTSVCIYI